MAREARVVNITEIQTAVDLLRLAEEVQKTGEPAVLRRDGEDLVELRPARPARKSRRKGQPTSADDPLWDIVGMGHSGGPGDVSENVDQYLADAHLANDA